MENEGSTGSSKSHWDRTLLYNEYMTASSMSDSIFSVFTLSLLEDSGWYDVNYEFADKSTFGYGAGCDFVREACYSKT